MPHENLCVSVYAFAFVFRVFVSHRTFKVRNGFAFSSKVSTKCTQPSILNMLINIDGTSMKILGLRGRITGSFITARNAEQPSNHGQRQSTGQRQVKAQQSPLNSFVCTHAALSLCLPPSRKDGVTYAHTCEWNHCVNSFLLFLFL